MTSKQAKHAKHKMANGKTHSHMILTLTLMPAIIIDLLSYDDDDRNIAKSHNTHYACNIQHHFESIKLLPVLTTNCIC